MKVRICYAVIDNSSKTYLLMAPKKSTVENVLDIINNKLSKKYDHLYLDGSELSNNEIVEEYIEPNSIFVASTEDTPPPTEFINSLRKSKGLETIKISPPKLVKIPMPIPNPSPTPNTLPTKQPTPGIFKSTLGNEHEGGISTEKIDKERKDVVGKYIFSFTGGSKEFLLEGIEVELDTKMTPDQVRDYLQTQVSKQINMENKQLIVYLSGGLPFISGTLGDVYLDKENKFSHFIYGVVTRQISDTVLNNSYPELCNINGDDRRLLISPICNSTELGLSDMACLLGYLNHDGAKGDLLLRTCAAVINFPPLITSMNKIINRNGVVGRDVITVTSTLYTFFRSYIPSTTKDENVFDYALRLCNLISHINDPPETIPLQTIEVKDGSSPSFLSNLNLGPIVYLWRPDIGEKFDRYDFKLLDEAAILGAYNIIASFRPIAPLSMRLITGCAIVRGKNHEYLYLMQSPSKKVIDQNKVDIIDPLTGYTQSVDIEDFSKDQEDDKLDKVDELIDPDNVKQIIMVNFDESGSMRQDLKGNRIPEGSEICSRFTISYQYLTTFANRTYGYRIPCIQGLISFGSEVTLRCPLSPLCPDFEDIGLKKVVPSGKTKLWDSLERACNEIVEFRKDSDGNERFKNAVSRILVISDGEDYKSTSKPIDIVPKLINNDIIVDCVIASSTDSCKELLSICHMTGGLGFRPKDVSEGFSLFEQGAFLNYSERKQSGIQIIKGDKNTTPRRLASNLSLITEEFMKKAKSEATIDTEIPNQDLIRAVSKTENLATPAHVCSKNKNSNIPSTRNRRILRELHSAAEVNDIKNKYYDPDMKILTLRVNLDRWKVFIKGPVNTPYENKWWHLLVTFPQAYPVQAPIIRFVSIPYHLNVSSEGRICLNCLEKGYISTKHVVDILQEIKEIFLLPQPESAIQLEKLDLFKHNFTEYEKLARKSTIDYAKDNYEDFITANIDDSVDEGFTLSLKEHIPPYMMSQISGNKIKDPVLSSTKVYYEREELRQLVASNQNPICVITGKPLTERPEDIDTL